MEAKLVIVSGATKAGEFILKLPTIIGRSRDVDLPLGHALVSRQHCKLFEDDGVLKLKDLGSLNGTYLGQDRITDEAILLPGALFTVGPVTFQAVYGEMPEAGVDASDFGEISDVVLPPRASDGLSNTNELSGAPPTAAAPKSAAKPPPAPSVKPKPQLAEPQSAEPEPAPRPKQSAPPAPPAAAASELQTEELLPPPAPDEADEFSLPEAPGDFEADQFDWLTEAPAPPAVSSSGDAKPPAEDVPSNTPSVGHDQTLPVDRTLDEDQADATPAAPREIKKKPGKGLFSRGAKPEKKGAKPERQKEPPPDKSKASSKEPPPAAAEKAAPVAEKPESEQPPEIDDLDFSLPPAEHHAPAKDPNLENTLDFLN